MIRILVVDDQKSVRERLIAILQTETDFQIVGTANDGYTAIEQVEVHRPDVVLLDMQMPNLDGVSATKIICQRFIGIKILMYSVHDNEDYISRALLSGAVGYLVKGSPDEELNEAIRFIYRGYTQIRPGWLDNLTALEPTYGDEVEDDETAVSNGVNGSNGNGMSDRGQLALQQQYEPQFFLGPFNESGKSGSWKNYIVPWLIANLIVWSAGLLYLRLAKPSYASSWAIALSAQNVTTNVSLPDIGEVNSRTESAFNQESADPRENYKFIAETDEVIANAAKKLKMTPDELGKPTIKIVDNTTLMRFQVKGDTPEQAQKKAKAIKQAFQEELVAKRNEEMSQQNGNLMNTLKEAEEKLRVARQKLTQYQETSGASSKDQVKELSTNVEALRRQQSEESAKLEKANGRYNRLLQDLGLTPAQAGDAFVLQSDRRFQKYLAEYSNLSGEEIALNAKYFPNHPAVVDKTAEVNEAKNALFARGRQLLGKPIDDNILSQLSLGSENSNQSKRADLFQELISLQAERQGLEAQTRELGNQLDKLEGKRIGMSKSGAILEELQQDVKFAEAFFSSTLAKVDLNKSTISSTYPPIATISKPSKPEKPSSPKSILVLLGTTACSAFLTTALLSQWWRDRHRQQTRSFQQQQTQPILPQRIDGPNSISANKYR
jgi:DNA-binding NarL/FixJ family response regulator/uncharacterized protein involved in exopolysaccharide biosynthesis